MAERKNLAALIDDSGPAALRRRLPGLIDLLSLIGLLRKYRPPGLRPPADMTMRSWYMPKASADRLAALVDDVHFATRLPKHLIMGALVNVIDRHRAEVEAEARSAVGQ